MSRPFGYHHTQKTKLKLSLLNSKPKFEVKCIICKKIFYVSFHRKDRKYCSRECFGIGKRGATTWNKGLTKDISPLLRQIGENISKANKGRIYKVRSKKICPICNNAFFLRPSISKIRKFCSRKCMGIWMSRNLKGKNSHNWKNGISKPKCIDCGKIIWIGFKRCLRCASKGKLNRNWKGGITPIRGLIHSLKEYKEWKFAILKKCNFTCQDCGKRGGRNLDVHHYPKSYSELVGEFLKQYNQFSPIEDKETLLRLAMTHQPFWDIDNAIILCRKCHQKTKNYFYKGATQCNLAT